MNMALLCDSTFKVSPSGRHRQARGAGARGFVGTWTGKAVDKPGEGHSERDLKLELRRTASGQLQGVVSGSFVDDDRAELEDLQIRANWLEFELDAATGRFRVRLELKGRSLVGEGMPLDPDEDACDITLRYGGEPPAPPGMPI